MSPTPLSRRPLQSYTKIERWLFSSTVFALLPSLAAQGHITSNASIKLKGCSAGIFCFLVDIKTVGIILSRRCVHEELSNQAMGYNYFNNLLGFIN
jgi:hypothetical protein